MAAMVRPRSGAALAVQSSLTDVRAIDRIVEAVRRVSERALPWFDPDKVRQEQDRERAILREAEQAQSKGREALGAYHRAALRRRS